MAQTKRWVRIGQPADSAVPGELVIDVADLPFGWDPKLIFSPDLQWIDASGTPQVSYCWSYQNGTFTPPVAAEAQAMGE